MQTPNATGAVAPTIAETLAKLGADDKTGLTDAEVQARLKKYGPNALVEKQKNTFAALLQYFWGPIPWMIEAAALMAFIVGGLGRFYHHHFTAVVQRGAGVLEGTRSFQRAGRVKEFARAKSPRSAQRKLAADRRAHACTRRHCSIVSRRRCSR